MANVAIVAGPPTADRRRFLRLSAIGATVAGAGLVWFILIGSTKLLFFGPFGNFFDAQANAWLAGRWDVGRLELFLEGFRIDGRTYTYFGAWPAVLRLPLLWIWPSLYGRLTRVSMILASGVFLAGVVALHWRIRTVLRPDRPFGRTDAVLAVMVPIVAALGSTMAFLASGPWVYHEAILWGVAWAVVGFERIIAFQSAPGVARLVGASVAATLAMASRVSIGIGVVVALGLIAGGQVLEFLRPHLARRSGGPLDRAFGRLAWLAPEPALAGAPEPAPEPEPGPHSGPRPGARWRYPRVPIVATIAATVVPTAIHAYVNWSRFGTFFSVPWRRQAIFELDESARRALDANGGDYFGLRYAPTTLWQFLRPDGLGIDGLFPWVSFQKFPTPVIGNVIIDALDFTTSVTATMPALLVLTAVAVIAAWSRPFSRTPQARQLRVPLIGAASGIAFVVTIAFVAQRYQGDWLPLLLLGGIAGVHVLIARREARAPDEGPSRAGHRARSVRPFVLVALGGLALVGVWVNSGIALVNQRLYAPHEDTLRQGMIGFQYDVDRLLGGGTTDAQFSTRLPTRPATGGTSAVMRDCDAMYWSDGRAWHLVQGRPRGGVVLLRGQLPPADGTWRPLASWQNASGSIDLIAIVRTAAGIRVERAQVGPDESWPFTTPEQFDRVKPAPLHHFEIYAPVDQPAVRVRIDRKIAYSAPDGPAPRGGPVRVGTTSVRGVEPTYGAALRADPPRIGVCQAILEAR